MTTRLYSTVEFNGVPGGGSVAVAHGIQIDNQAQIPDYALPPTNSSLRITAIDATNVTVQNDDAAPQSGAVWVGLLHTYLRAFGAEGTADLSTKPYIPAGAGGGGGGAIASPRTAFVFRPGGVQAENVYTVWADLVAAIATVEGPTVVFFDDSIVSPIVIPAGGPYDMTDVEWTSYRTSDAFASQVPINIAAGATFTNLLRFAGNINVTSQGAPAPVALSPGDLIVIRDNATVQSNNATPFFDGTGVGNGEAAIFSMDDVGQLGGGGVAVVDFPTAASTLVLSLGVQATVPEDALSVAAGAALLVTYRSTSAFINSAQAAMLGTLTDFELTVPRWSVQLRGAATPVAAAVGQLNQHDPSGGPIVVNLPAVSAFNKGNPVTIKNGTASVANPINITPAGADTIDGAAGVTALQTAFGSVTLVSDGVSNWIVT